MRGKIQRKLLIVAIGFIILTSAAIAQIVTQDQAKKPTELVLDANTNKEFEGEDEIPDEVPLPPEVNEKVMWAQDEEAAEEAAERKQRQSWIMGAWTESDEPFLKLKKRIESELLAAKTSPKMQEIAERYEAQAKENPKDPQAVFAWAYANRKAAGLDLTHNYTNYRLSDAFEAAPTPLSYEYVRLRYIVEAQQKFSEDLISLAKRLLQKKPDDTAVMYLLCDLLDTDKVDDRHLFDKLIGVLLEKFPNQAGLYEKRATFYHAAYLSSKQNQHKTKALGNYETYLKMEKDTEAREWVKINQLDVLRKMK